MLIGQGFDVHRLGEGYRLVIGGVHIPYHLGLIGHSDGDVVLHALTDALLGAAGLGDIGHHFPDTDPDFKGIDSRILLRRAYAKLTEMDLKLHNADITIMAEAPKMAPHLEQMCAFIASDLQTDVKRINIKATTTEKLGFTGRGEGIAANAVVLLLEAEDPAA